MVRSMIQSEPVGSGPESFESVLTQDDLRTLHGFYFILAEFEIKLAGPGERVDRPPPSCLGVYEEALKASLRFSLHSFVVQLMNVYHLSPAQIVPNSWRFVIGFFSLCFLLGVEPLISLFRAYYLLKAVAKDGSWWYFTLRKDRCILQDAPSSIHG